MRRPLFRWAQARLITPRSTAILVTASVIGAAAGTLTYLAYYSIPQALLSAGAAAGGTARLLHQLIDPDPERPNSSQDKGQDDDVGQLETQAASQPADPDSQRKDRLAEFE